MQNRLRIPGRVIAIALGVFVVALLLFSFSSQFFYFFEQVDAQEIGLQFESGRITNVVGPGVYSDAGLFVKLVRVPQRAVTFTVTDEELITKDKQRIGVVVTGDVFRPGLDQADLLRALWAEYNQAYTNDEALITRISSRAQQAMKVCVGDRTFDEAAIGTARDNLRLCIDEELGELSSNLGLVVDNVAVPNVIISTEVQAGLDAIVRSRLETEQARQDELRAAAQARAEQARQEGEIRVQQSRIQEEARQQITLAQLEQERIQAQRAVIEAERANELARVEAQRAIIEAEKSNELLAAQSDLEIATAQAAAAAQQAQAEVAVDAALAALYASAPDFVRLQMAEANARALKTTDKIIFTPEGMTPTLVLPGPGIVPTVDTTSAEAVSTAPAGNAAAAAPSTGDTNR